MGIAARIRVFAMALVALMAVLLGAIALWGFQSITKTLDKSYIERQADSKSRSLRSTFIELTRVTQTLAGLHELPGLARAAANGDTSAQTELADAVAAVFERAMRTNSAYDQLRFIGVADQGMELVRVDQQGGQAYRIPDSRLQRKGDRDYFSDMIRPAAGVVTFSKIDLNQEHGQIEIPYRPMLRLGTPVVDADGQKIGILVINVNFRIMVNETLGPPRQPHIYYIADTDGDYLVHPDSSLTFGFALGKRHRVQDDFAQFRQSAAPGSDMQFFQNGPGTGRARDVVGFTSVGVFPGDQDRYLTLGIVGDHAAARSTIAHVNEAAVVALAIILPMAMFVAYWLARRMLQPIEAITQSADAISAGQPHQTLPISRRDEIGKLARAMAQMLASLDQRAAALNESNKELTAANSDLEHFAHVASHDLREPVRRISALSDLLFAEEHEHVTPDGQDLLQRIQSESQRMLGQITDFRALAEIGTGALSRSTIDLRELIEAVLEPYTEAVSERGIFVQFDLMPSISAYDTLLRVLYARLIDNALEHSPPGAFNLNFSHSVERGTSVFGVRNSGSSIPSKHLIEVFSPFTRVDNRSTGRGLGLSMSRRIVERHAGRIWAESGQDFVHIKFTLGGS